MAAASLANSDLGRFGDEVKDMSLFPLWERTSGLKPGSNCVPAHWSYAEVRPQLIRACGLITKKEAERRVLCLENPSLRGTTFICDSLFAGLQIIAPGEIAPSHRHTPSALRFIIEGEGAYTAVNGERIYMHQGDFIVTPAWTWHDHGKESDGVMIWLDGLDVPLVNHLGATFSDDYDGEGAFPQSRPPHDSFSRYSAGMLPLEPITQRASPVFAYPYERTRTALENLRKANDWDACHGLKLKFANPATGDWVMPTIATFAQLLPKGFKTAPYRSTEATVVMAAEGTGKATVGERTYTLGKNDIFVVPNWTWWQVEASDDLVLLSYSDRAALEKLDLWREQRANEPPRL